MSLNKVTNAQFYLIVFSSAISSLENTHFKWSQSIFSCLQHYSYINNSQILTVRSSINLNSYSLPYPSYLSPKGHWLFNIISNQFWSVSEKTAYSDRCSKTSQSRKCQCIHLVDIRKFCLCLIVNLSSWY